MMPPAPSLGSDLDVDGKRMSTMSSKTTRMIRVELHEDAKVERERNERKDDDEKWRETERERETGVGGGYLRMNE